MPLLSELRVGESGTDAGAPIVFLATPVHDGRVHAAYMNGVLQASGTGRLLISRHTSSSLPTSRDVLTARFLRSRATHMLCVDSDIGWGVRDMEKLVLADKDFVTGIYTSKQSGRALAVGLSENREGELVEAHFASAGFLLLTRSCLERMVAAHPELIYSQPTGEACALWAPIFNGKPYGEEIAFCSRWQALGGQIWAHQGVIVKRYGEAAHLPRNFEALR